MGSSRVTYLEVRLSNIGRVALLQMREDTQGKEAAGQTGCPALLPGVSGVGMAENPGGSLR